ncbi:hypothetical protein [Nannocystis punicea]|uniref:Uncharacterized protein n=1 Tax=Nannocystis punicea TaxID=2995304 RepID=A0ABY7H232_9BACT|nr:hypothetical protein [Nannocystis poenicansa]WAS93124.1 hypothetical protein O0S08_43735 [Nannocystis poenicansa]
MAEEALPPRKYLVWIWVAPDSRSVITDVVGSIAREPARLERWLDAEARTALDFRVGLDLAGLQQARDSELRAVLREALPDVPEAGQKALEAALAQPRYLPSQPLGMAYVLQVGAAIGENPQNRKPPTQVPDAGLLALRVLEAGGTVRVTRPEVEGRTPVSSRTLRELFQTLRNTPRLWVKWCNLCTIHRHWEAGFKQCVREAAAGLPESERATVRSWLEGPDWWLMPDSAALRGSAVLQGFTSKVVERELVRGM